MIAVLLDINHTGPALLHVSTMAANVLLELQPGQVERLAPYWSTLVPNAAPERPLVVHHLGKTHGSRGFWSQECPWYETMDSQSLEFLGLDPDVLLAWDRKSVAIKHIAIPTLQWDELKKSTLMNLNALVSQSENAIDLQERLEKWVRARTV